MTPPCPLAAIAAARLPVQPTIEAPPAAPVIRLSRAAELSGISERTLRRQAMRGKIPGARQDDIGHWWIPETAVGTLERGKAGNPKWKSGVPQPRAKNTTPNV